MIASGTEHRRNCEEGTVKISGNNNLTSRSLVRIDEQRRGSKFHFSKNSMRKLPSGDTKVEYRLFCYFVFVLFFATNLMLVVALPFDSATGLISRLDMSSGGF